MRLARRALVCALTIFVLAAMASAQTLRQENDPRNQAPAVGTGGPPGGPTGLFTIYDGDTLRKGEFTFSISYSNFDRDPGNVDLTEIPLTFNVGLNDHIELFYNMLGYRGIKVNTPTNLSGFYLPDTINSQITGAGTGVASTGASIIIFPTGPTVGNLGGLAAFNPPFNQPFSRFPYVGASAGAFLQGPGARGTLFGFPGFSANIGPVVLTGSGGQWGSADSFPGIGSPVGGILPGIVLATATLPCTILTGACPPLGGATPANPIVVPTTFTIAPSYLPDAPFISRRYGQSSFSTSVVGAKIRLTGPNNPLGVVVMPMYRFYHDSPDDLRGWTQLQRGASPGGTTWRGDWGLYGVLSGRLSRSVNLSVNAGYWLNSSVRSKAFGANKVTLLDRPDEFQTGVGFDFPVNKYFQPIAELRSTWYVGGRTPNAFQNNPLEGLIGARVYPKRWFGLSVAYRRHLNQQEADRFNPANFNTQINQVSGVVVRGTTIIVPGTTRAATAGGFPNGFAFSDDPNGFLFQFFIGHRNARAPEFLPNQPPTVTLSASSGTVTVGCPEGMISPSGCAPSSRTIQLSANATDPDGDTLLYTYSVSGGRVTGDGPSTSWDLSGVQPGTYTASVTVDDGCGCVAYSSTTVTVANCTDCVPPCPTLTVSCPTGDVTAGTPATVSANVSGGAPNMSVTYNWSVSNGTISSGQGTPSITIDTTGMAGQSVTATVEIGGVAATCQRTASCTFTVAGVPPPVNPRKFDTYGNIRFNDEKARLDNFAVELQSNPGAQGYIVAYGSCTGEGQARADRAKGYLVNNRGIDAGRIVTVDGGCMEALTVELWIVPTGATPPTASPTVTPCPECKAKRRTTRRTTTRRGTRRRGDDEE